MGQHTLCFEDIAVGAVPPQVRKGPLTTAHLVRWSAAMENWHRIHYDRTWAMQVEGYPGLVVHGPLTTTLLIDFARDQNPGKQIASYATQARAPLFDTAPFELRGRPATNGRGCDLWAATPDGTIAMSAEVELA